MTQVFEEMLEVTQKAFIEETEPTFDVDLAEAEKELQEDDVVPLPSRGLKLLAELRARGASEPKETKHRTVRSATFTRKSPFNKAEFFEKVIEYICNEDDTGALKGKKLTMPDGTIFKVCDQRLAAGKQDAGCKMIVEFQETALVIDVDQWLDSGPRDTKTWENISFYAGGTPSQSLRLSEYCQELHEFLGRSDRFEL